MTRTGFEHVYIRLVEWTSNHCMSLNTCVTPDAHPLFQPLETWRFAMAPVKFAITWKWRFTSSWSRWFSLRMYLAHRILYPRNPGLNRVQFYPPWSGLGIFEVQWYLRRVVDRYLLSLVCVELLEVFYAPYGMNCNFDHLLFEQWELLEHVPDDLF